MGIAVPHTPPHLMHISTYVSSENTDKSGSILPEESLLDICLLWWDFLSYVIMHLFLYPHCFVVL
jgi:hypothetical protein